MIQPTQWESEVFAVAEGVKVSVAVDSHFLTVALITVGQPGNVKIATIPLIVNVPRQMEPEYASVLRDIHEKIEAVLPDLCEADREWED